MSKIIILGAAVLLVGVMIGIFVAGRQSRPSVAPADPVDSTTGVDESVAPPAVSTGVIINNRVLSVPEVAALKARYGVEPVAGNYWYDGRSGAYGVVGGPAIGVMYPGHDFGPLDPRASNGDANVFFNGRELTQTEAVSVAALFGTPVIPGRYWVEANGNIGIEGNSTPLANIYVALSAATRRGGGGGDNFWSSRFSAGNYNDQGQGYVSVPGYGPVGYGFD